MTGTPQTLTTDECEKLLYELLWQKRGIRTKPKNVRNYCMALLMLDAGLRVGEVVKLQWISLWYNSVPVTSIIVSAEIAKNKKERIIPTSQRLSDAIENCHRHFGTPDPSSPEDCAMQPLRIAFPLTTRQVERIIRKAAMKSLGRPVHPHVLRHTFASRLMRTTNARIVQELLGHKHITTTQIYTHPNQEDLKKAIGTLEDETTKLGVDLENLAGLADVPNRTDTMHTHRDMR